MKIRVLSDLHLEMYYEPDDAGIRDDIDCDVVVLAGDIAKGTRGIEWAAETFRAPVVYVMGNHEYYGHDVTELLPQARKCAAELGVYLLENDEVCINNRRFLGCTLWSGFEAGPASWTYNARRAQPAIADFRRIQYQGEYVMPSRMTVWHQVSREWLKEQLSADDPSVVVTHFVPSLKAINPQFGSGDELTPYFTNDMEYLMGAAVPVWIYGHNHYSDRTKIENESGTTLVASNQYGYPGEQGGFASDFVITI